jgi:large subunit ribosomal protein L25
MRKDITVAAQPRLARGKNEARRLRAKGSVPAVLYGAGGSSVAVAVNPKEINKILHSSTGHNTIFDVALDGEHKTPAMIVDWLLQPVKGTLLHVDLKRIDLTKQLHVKVPVHTTGDPVGVKTQGGLLEAVTREILIECLPDDIPEHFTVDVTSLVIGQSLRAADVPLAKSMKLVSHGDQVICHVVALRTSVEETAPAEAAAATGETKAEPEVMKKGKKEEEGAAPAAKEKEKAPAKEKKK